MKEIQNLICSSKPQGIGDYLSLSKKIEDNINRKCIKTEKAIKIAILSSFTVNGIKEALMVKCSSLCILSKFYIGGYGQYVQEILNQESELYRFNPDLIIVLVDTMSICGDNFYFPYRLTEEQRISWVKNKCETLHSLMLTLKKYLSSKILLNNFEVPFYSPLGICENKQSFGFIEMIEELNRNLRIFYKTDSQVFIFDYNSFCSKIGKQQSMNYKMYYLGDMKLDLKYIPDLCDEYMSYIKPTANVSRKCIVLDLDNTLWGGVIGEDGLDGIKLGPYPEGRPFWEFQKYLLALFDRGILLAVNSKNNLEDALNVFKNNQYMLLNEEHFSSMQINWNDKITNMKAIAKEINISLDSLVFIDDDKVNREIIRQALPEVFVVDLPEDSSLYSKTLMELSEFNTFAVTEEDKKRGRMYGHQRKRNELKIKSSSIDEYLKELEIVVTIEKANPINIPRISQLCQKTNQFNMTNKRYTIDEINEISNCSANLVLAIQVRDKFGDSGISGVAIITKNMESWKIDNLLLSCRVIGRKIEDALLHYILELAKKENVKTLVGEFIPSGKNLPAMNFFSDNGFILMGTEENKKNWKYDISNDYLNPDFIKTIIKGT